MSFRASLIVALSLACALPALGQSPPPDSGRRSADTLSLDSLRARLARAEAAIAILKQQVGDEAESAVHTRSRFRVDLSAQILTNAFLTSGRVNNVDVPQTVLPPATTGQSGPVSTAASVGATVRQSRIGLAASVADVAGGVFSGDVDIDFFGGVQNGPGDRRLFPEPRLRTARLRLLWPRTELMVGSDVPLISTLNPLSLASVGSPDFSGAGNLWNWLGQVRVTQDLGSLGSGARQVRWAIAGAVMTPYAAQLAPAEPDAIDAGERSERPAFEGRFSMRWSGKSGSTATVSDALIGDAGGEIGIGMHRSWVATGAGPLIESHAVSVDAHAVLFPRVELRGEAYTGRLLRGLGGGAIGQNFGAAPVGAPIGAFGPPIRDAAGWAQLNVQPHETLITGVGCGVDLTNPHDAGTRLQNSVCAAHADWRPAQPLVFGLEYRQLGTRYSSGTFGARHLNFIFGFEL